MKIAFFEVEDWEIPYLKKKFPNDELFFSQDHVTEENIKQVSDSDILSVFIYSPITKDILAHLPNVKLVATRSTGFDHIDLKACKANNITVCNVPTYGSNTVAEHTFMLIFALSRKLVPSIERTRRGNFEIDGLRGFDLHEKTLGIIGLGHIGMEVIRIARGIGMHVVCYTKHPNEKLARKLHVTFLSLPELLRVSDVVTLHLPYSKQTHHIINKKNIKKMKKGSLLINTARGGLVETEAILYALQKGILGGVGLDVLEGECHIKEERQLLSKSFKQECDLKVQLMNHVLLDQENVLVTPHNAFNSIEALQRIVDITVENIIAFEKGKVMNTVSAS